ncbi:MAG: PTS galactitol transporter subunit IIC, partial [Defluviitaleaceae bacterium]|nr:PTS galactitol transporter subunit IIC [Defluviitaleaceae bacterium]
AGIKVGIGFTGLNLVIGLMAGGLGSAAQAMVERIGIDLATIDVGWPAAAAISYGTILGSMSIPIGIGLNVLLIILGLTKTMYVDLWNYWHAAFIGSLVFVITGSFGLGLLAIISYILFLFLFGDIVAPIISKFYGFNNLTFPHGIAIPGVFFAFPLNWLFDRLPIIKNLQADQESLQKKFGIFGETAILGFIIGLVIGILAGYDIGGVGNLAIQTAAVLVIMPRMITLLMEGLLPISEAANAFVSKRFPGKELYLGLDAALAVGHPTVLAASLVLIPITIVLAIILPGNTTIPFVDLATIPFAICLMVPIFKGNIVRTIISGTIYMASLLWIASWVAPLVTQAAIYSDFDLAGHASITAMISGGQTTTLLYVVLSRFGWVGLGVITVTGLLGMIYMHKILTKR